MIQIGGVYTTFCHREGIHLQKYAIEMGGVSRYFFTCIILLGSGVDLTLLIYRKGNSVKRSVPFSEPPDSEN